MIDLFSEANATRAPRQAEHEDDMTLHAITHFRALAIVFVVASHTILLAHYDTPALAQGTVINLLTGATVFFVLISGILFQHVFVPRYTFRRFMRSKLRNVALPYLVLALPLTVFVVLHETSGEIGARFFYGAHLLISGNTVIAYWYVPAILVMFLMSPLHMAYQRLSLEHQLSLLAVLYLLSNIVQRSVEDILIPQSVIYFTPVYLTGMTYVQHREAVLPWLKRLTFPLFVSAILLAMAAAETGHYGNYHTDFSLRWSEIDLMMPQKLALSFAFLGLLERYGDRPIAWSQNLADASFGVFFLHAPMIYLLLEAGYQPLFAAPLANIAVMTGVLFALCLSSIALLRRVFPNHSRQLVGA
ncbi:acyltransferase [Celeribacter sp. PS-C1]|uniref:acyltransferase family protein n=1 Tax=Celeribacter sp. PS-C1 TaxID=2820813 RepID=UPI001C6716C7|nr:acyltransferase [Celeribacter sp. PS-C1]MBW6416752.1 acyltransferase [Celeribacter sp. PS-C1]